MRTVPLHGKKAAGRVALVDDGDYDLVMAYRWNLNEHPNPRSGRPVGPYAMTNIPQGDGRYRNTSMHTLITGWPRVDHADHNGLNNQRSNLRPATGQQNAANRVPLKGCASPFKGVFRSHRSPRWYAGIRKDGKRYHLGVFDTEEEAARAYDAAAKEMFGEYAYLNFP